MLFRYKVNDFLFSTIVTNVFREKKSENMLKQKGVGSHKGFPSLCS